MELDKIKGLKVVAIKGFRRKVDKRIKHPKIEPQYILFSENKIIILTMIVRMLLAIYVLSKIKTDGRI
jgi:hypothetical protein